METQIENILVFATNIKNESDKLTIGNLLDENPKINQWSIDQEDIDCVLRIESETLSEEQIINLLNNQNFYCSTLD